jgi:hypothetical protein
MLYHAAICLQCVFSWCFIGRSGKYKRSMEAKRKNMLKKEEGMKRGKFDGKRSRGL